MTAPIKLSESQRRALGIIKEFPSVGPRDFARMMWPDSPGWKSSSGHGAHTRRGGGMWLAGGAYLGRLRAAGLIVTSYYYGHRRHPAHSLTLLAKELLKTQP